MLTLITAVRKDKLYRAIRLMMEQSIVLSGRVFWQPREIWTVMDNVSICVGRSSLGAATRGRTSFRNLPPTHRGVSTPVSSGCQWRRESSALQFLQNGIVAIAVNTNRQRSSLWQTLPFPTRYEIDIKGKKKNLPHLVWKGFKSMHWPLEVTFTYRMSTPAPGTHPRYFVNRPRGNWGCDRAWLWIFSTFIIGPKPPHSICL